MSLFLLVRRPERALAPCDMEEETASHLRRPRAAWPAWLHCPVSVPLPVTVKASSGLEPCLMFAVV